MFRCLAIAILLLAAPAAAQQRLVVPADAALVVPPRGGALPAPKFPPDPRPRPRLAELPPHVPATSFAGYGLPAALAGAALAGGLAAALSGGGGGVSAPARTR